MLLALTLVICALPTVALAADEGESISISTEEQLKSAIQNQADGQVWEISAGTYDIGDAGLSVNVTINGETGFVFPIYANNLTIRGIGDVTITSSYNPGAQQGGVWHNQNFITISGQGVVLENLSLKGNPNDYYDGGCNKVIELAGTGRDLTLTGITLLPYEYDDGTQNSTRKYIGWSGGRMSQSPALTGRASFPSSMPKSSTGHSAAPLSTPPSRSVCPMSREWCIR